MLLVMFSSLLVFIEPSVTDNDNGINCPIMNGTLTAKPCGNGLLSETAPKKNIQAALILAAAEYHNI